ncbi:metal-sensitive transcriptional regulator [Agromyces tardus]|jgi:DNA-binding FrmR family transcriptional regulator|uniref:Metal-sensitive transcriptional regulator n=1 Tax=Agromyces tardus TaxID=2583849 RepID=A0A3M8A495_9MICO|nr:metal-sensitive transcriptional regulator [Agromyces tardus]RNB46048.1 metal-sensitive transcriptional regulator [Agromyces tardus]
MSTAAADQAEAQRRILNRLKRARGQLNAVIDAVEAGGDCRTVVTQLAAVSSALDRAGFAVISSAMRDCATDAADVDAEGADAAVDGKERLTFDELEKLFLSLS